MKTLHIIAITAAAAAMTFQAAGQSKAQQLQFKEAEKAYNTVREAISPALAVVRTSYLVADYDFANFYGFEGDSIFGASYSVAVNTTAGTVLAARAVEPWKSDRNYAPYLDNEQYQPYISSTMFSPLEEKADFKPLMFMDGSLPEPLDCNDGIFVALTNIAETSQTLECVAYDRPVSGIAVWFYNELASPLSLGNADVNMKFSPCTANFSPSECTVPVTNRSFTKSPAIGGIFLVPEYPGNGTVVFKVGGFIVPAGETDKWVIARASVTRPAIFNNGITPVLPPEEQPAAHAPLPSAGE